MGHLQINPPKGWYIETHERDLFKGPYKVPQDVSDGAPKRCTIQMTSRKMRYHVTRDLGEMAKMRYLDKYINRPEEDH